MAAFTLAHLSDPHLPPLPAAAAARARGQARARLSQLDAQPPQIPSPRGAGCAGRRTCRRRRPITSPSPAISSISRSKRNFRRRGAWLESVGAPERVTVDPRQSRRLCSRHRASLRRSLGELSSPATTARGGAFPSLRRRGPLALIGVSIGGADAAADGDGHGSDATSSRRSSGCWQRLAAEDVFRVLLVHHPAALGFARQAADRFRRTARAFEAARRGAGPARARPRSFDDLGRGTERHDPRDRRAVGVRPRARPLSRRGLQSVFDRARRRWLALRADVRGIDGDVRYREIRTHAASSSTIVTPTTAADLEVFARSPTVRQPNSASAPSEEAEHESPEPPRRRLTVGDLGFGSGRDAPARARARSCGGRRSR